MKSIRHSVRVIILILIVAAQTLTVSAQNRRWVSFGPSGGSISSIAIDPQNSDIMYVGTDNRKAFKSTDAGTTWRTLDLNVGSGAYGSIGPFAIDPRDSNTIYAGTAYLDRPLLKSTDGGSTWTALGPFHWPGTTVEIKSGEWFVVLDPHNPDTVWASHYDPDSGGSGPWRSTDGGATWRLQSPTGDAMYAPVSAIVFDPRQAKTLYVVTTNALYQSTDGGGSWKWLTSAPGLRTLAIDPENTNILYAGTYTGMLFQSTDRGITWRPVLQLSSPPRADVRSIVVDSQTRGTIYVATGRGFYHITNAGSTWTAVKSSSSAGAVMGFAVDPKNPRTTYAGTEEGLLKSTDAGRTWKTVNIGGHFANVVRVRVDNNSGTVYASSSNRLSRSTDGARTWNDVDMDLQGSYFSLEAIASIGPPLVQTIIYATAWLDSRSHNQLFRSTDFGRSWTSSSLGLPALDVIGVVVDPRNADIAYARINNYAGSASSSLFKTTNGGTSWRPAGLNTLPVRGLSTMAMDPRNPNILYVQQAEFYPSSGPALFKSFDAGETWTKFSTPGYFYEFAIPPQNSDVVYAAGGYSGFYKSTDGGMSWNLLKHSGCCSHLHIHPAEPDTIYAGDSDGLYKSVDGGESWSVVDEIRLPVTGLASDPQKQGKIYAATARGGVYAVFDSPNLKVDRSAYCVGDSWTLTITGGQSASPIRLIGVSNAQTWEVPVWQWSTSSGEYEEKGTFGPGTLGSHTIHVEIDGIPSNKVDFGVSSCNPNEQM